MNASGPLGFKIGDNMLIVAGKTMIPHTFGSA